MQDNAKIFLQNIVAPSIFHPQIVYDGRALAYSPGRPLPLTAGDSRERCTNHETASTCQCEGFCFLFSLHLLFTCFIIGLDLNLLWHP